MKFSPVKLGLSVLAGGAAVLLLDAWFLEQYFFQVKRFRIGKENSEKKIKILLLTDLHFKERFWPFHQKLVKKIKELKPDLILVSGDVIDEHGTPGPARKFFGLLNPAVPKVVIPGNHDNKNNVSRGTLRKVVEQRNGYLLINETLQLMIDHTLFTITGIDDSIEGESDFTHAVKNVGKEDHHFLLVHSPLQQEDVLIEMQEINARRTADNRLDIQYIFAGHNHGGQVRVGNFVPVLPKGAGNYINGWYNKEKPYLYLSKGFGTSTVPFRFGARPEITLFEYGV